MAFLVGRITDEYNLAGDVHHGWLYVTFRSFRTEEDESSRRAATLQVPGMHVAAGIAQGPMTAMVPASQGKDGREDFLPPIPCQRFRFQRALSAAIPAGSGAVLAKMSRAEGQLVAVFVRVIRTANATSQEARQEGGRPHRVFSLAPLKTALVSDFSTRAYEPSLTIHVHTGVEAHGGNSLQVADSVFHHFGDTVKSVTTKTVGSPITAQYIQCHQTVVGGSGTPSTG